jgi:hypothetical protein
MKKKSGIFVDNLPSRLVKNSFLSVYRKFQKNKGEKSGNSKKIASPSCPYFLVKIDDFGLK